MKGRKQHLVVGSQGSVLGVWVSPAEVSDARGARVVLESVLRRYPSAQIVIADGAYDKEGLLEWLLGEFCVALDCVFRAGKGFVVLERRWLVERSFAWVLGCRRLSRCYDGLCVVEACWIEWACVRWLVRRMAGEKKCYTVSNHRTKAYKKIVIDDPLPRFLYQSRSQSSQKRVCPITPSLRFPLQAGGTEPTRPTRFPSRSGGNLKEGGQFINSERAIGINAW